MIQCEICQRGFHEILGYKAHYKLVHKVELNLPTGFKVPKPSKSRDEIVASVERNMKSFFIDHTAKDELDVLIDCCDSILIEIGKIERAFDGK